MSVVTPRRAALQGVLDRLPFLPSDLMWGLIFGGLATAAGLSAAAASLMSAIVYSGTAQMAVVKLPASSLASVFLLSLLLSVRFVPMVLALNQRLELPRWARTCVFSMVDDAVFALAIRRGWSGRPLAFYLLGCGLWSYSNWVIGTAVGTALAPVALRSWASTVDAFTSVIFVVLVAGLCTSRLLVATALLAGVLGAAIAAVLPTGAAVALAAVITACAVALAPRPSR
jgi:predicted branched-subunit amino acid permease